MFVTTDATIMTMLLNVIFQKGKDPKLVVEQLDRTLDECLVLPEKKLVRFCASQVKRVSRWTRRHRAETIPIVSVASRETGKGTPSFEVSKRRALDRANSWQIPQHVFQVRRMSGKGPGSAARRSEPVEPMYVGDHVQDTPSSHTPDAVESTSVEEHLERESVVTCK